MKSAGFANELTKKLLENALSITALIYVLGFVVANSYYARLGIVDYQLLQARYIGAGLSFFVSHLALTIGVLLIRSITKRDQIFFWMIFPISGYLFLLAVTSGIFWGLSLFSVINALTVCLIAYLIWLGVRNQFKTIYDFLSIAGISKIYSPFLIGGSLFTLIFCCAFSWGTTIWPITSSVLGGGRASEAVFVLEENYLLDVSSLFPMRSREISEQLPVLFETSDEYVILLEISPGVQSAVRLPRASVKMVIYAPSTFFGKKENINIVSASSTPSQSVSTVTSTFTPTLNAQSTKSPTP